MFHHSLVNKSDEVVKAVTKPPIKKPSLPRDPDKIKQPPTSYIIFCSDQRKILQDENPDLPFADLGRLMGEKWRQLDDPAKAPYIQKALEKRAEYEQAVRVQEQKRRESGDYSHTTETKASKTKRVKPEKGMCTTGGPTPYSLFCHEQRPLISEQNPHLTHNDIGKMLSDSWKKLDFTLKNPYMEMAEIQKRDMPGTIQHESIAHSMLIHHHQSLVDNNEPSVVVVPAISMHESEVDASVDQGAQNDDDEDDDNGDEEV